MRSWRWQGDSEDGSPKRRRKKGKAKKDEKGKRKAGGKKVREGVGRPRRTCDRCMTGLHLT